MFRVEKTFKFDAAHRLITDEGIFYDKNKCGSIHGHTYSVTFIFAAGQLNDYGFVKDFAELGVLKKWIDQHWDHATIVSTNDIKLLTFLKESGDRHFEFEGTISAENMAKYLFEKAKELVTDVKICQVRLKETETSVATYEESHGTHVFGSGVVHVGNGGE